jgi:uncharacterized protein (DUF58 family)
MYLGRPLPLAVLALAVAVVLVPAQAWVVLAGGAVVVAALVAFDVVTAPSGAALRLRRQAPSVLRLRRPGEVRLVGVNPTGRALEVAVHDATLPSLQRLPRRQGAVIEPHGRIELTSQIAPTRRGRFTLGPVTVRTAGRLGLAGRQATLPIRSELKVYPALRGREEVELRVRRSRLLQAGVRSSAIRGGGSTFDALREYVPDDEFRRINWRATARSTRAVTNQYREERNQQVILLLDASRAMAGHVDGVARLEHALDAAIAVAELGARIGDHVGVVAFGRDVRAQLDPRGGRGQPHRIVDLLFGLEPALDAPNYRRAFAAVLRRQRRRALMILFTDVAERTVLEPLLEAVPVLLARHIVVVAAVRDPVVESMAGARPGSSEEAYDKAAAAGFIAWRDSAAGLLRRMGVPTFDLHPNELAGRVADEYLRIKALGRL